MIKKKKQIIAVCLLGLSSLTLSGCGNQPIKKAANDDAEIKKMAHQLKLAHLRQQQAAKKPVVRTVVKKQPQRAQRVQRPRQVTSAQRAVWVAQKQLRIPYLWGGTSPKTGFDCSGLVQYSYKKNNIRLPRTAAQQYAATKPVHPKSAKSGDLVFFRNTGKRKGITHVGLYLGNGKFIHAPRKGKTVEITKVNHKYWGKHIAGYRRVTTTAYNFLKDMKKARS
ncbi:MAG: C40 family peptidase [bacterium]